MTVGHEERHPIRVDNDDKDTVDVEESMVQMKRRALSMYRKMSKEAYRFVTYFEHHETSPRVMKLIGGESIFTAVRSHFRAQLAVYGRQLSRAWKEYLEETDADAVPVRKELLHAVVQRMDDEMTHYTYYLWCALARTYRECLLHNKSNKRKNIDHSVRMHMLKLFSEEQTGNDAFKRSIMDAMVDLEKLEWEKNRWRKMKNLMQAEEIKEPAVIESSGKRRNRVAKTEAGAKGAEDGVAYEVEKEKDPDMSYESSRGKLKSKKRSGSVKMAKSKKKRTKKTRKSS